MARGADELVDYLVDSVALHFAEGATIDHFKEAVTNFYAKEDDVQQNPEVPVDKNLVAYPDRQLLARAWAWLLRHPDIWVGIPATDPNSAPEILVEGEQNASVLSLTAAEAENSGVDGAAAIRIWTSHERVWRSVAGHGVDYKRIPGEEFRLLCLIVGAGPSGIAQPELVKISKQDKKSVPGRTDNLYRNGYIKKAKIFAERHNTSLLTHKRFWTEEDIQNLESPVFLNGHLIFEGLLASLQSKLKNGAQMKMDDLEELLGCAKKSWEKKSLWRALERLDILGIIQRYRVNITREKGARGARNVKTRFLRLLREPTDEDYRRYTNLTVKDREEFRQRLEAQDADSRGEHAEYNDDEADNTVHTTSNAMAALPDPATSGPETTAQLYWDPDTPWPLTLFKVLEEAGAEGLTSQSVRDRTYGRFYDRPMEQMLSRLTDAWQDAQPDHLKYFSIIRDTDAQGRATSYLYRSHDGFQKAVDLGNTVWDAATNGKPYQQTAPVLDEYGFPKIDEKFFLRKGTASLGDAIKSAKIHRGVTTRTDPIIGKRTDGTLTVVWNRKKDDHEVVKQAKRNAKVRPKAGRVINEDSDQEREAEPETRPEPEVETEAFSRQQEELRYEERTKRIREQAESIAYDEARKNQKSNDLPASIGARITPTWKAGSGRPKLIIIDDVIEVDENNLTPFNTGKRAPILVRETRVQALVQEITARPDLDTEQAAAGEPQRDRLLIKFVSPRLSELEWFLRETEIQEVTAVSSQANVIAKSARTTSMAHESGPTDDLPMELITAAGHVHLPIPASQIPKLDLTLKSKKRPISSPKTPSNRVKKIKTIHTSKETPTTIIDPPETVIREEIELNQPSAPKAVDIAHSEPKAQKENGHVEPSAPDTVEIESRTTETDEYNERMVPIAPSTAEVGSEMVESIPISTQISPSKYRDQSQMPPGKSTTSKYRPRKTGIMVGRGTAMYKRTLVIQDILTKCGGVFPGDNEMVNAFQKTQRDDPKAAITSDRDTIMKTVKSMVTEGKLIRATFYIDDREGKKIQRWLLLQPGVDPSCEKAKALMEKIRERYPMRYNPFDEDESRPVQRKNIDRFRYYPGRDHLPPAGADFIIDIEARRRELESQRLAAEEKKRSKQQARLEAQAERNRRKQHQLAQKPRVPRPVPRKAARPNSIDDQENRDDPDRIMPSIEGELDDLIYSRSGRARYRGLRLGPDHYNKRILIHDRLIFQEPLTAEVYDKKYGRYGMPSLLDPVQLFYPKIGTFSTEFSTLLNAHDSRSKPHQNYSYEHHDVQNPDDLRWYRNIDNRYNNYHPDKDRKIGAGRLSKRTEDLETDDESDVQMDPAWFEKQQLDLMKEQHPGLIHEPTMEGFVNLRFGHGQQIAQKLYQHGIKPMDHVVIHGASIENVRGIEFEDNSQRLQIPREAGYLDPDLEESFPLMAETLQAPRALKSRQKAQLGSLVEYSTRTSDQPQPASRRVAVTQSGACCISSADSRRLFFACIAIRTLSGDLDGSIRWGPINQIFANHPNFDLPTFKARWGRMAHNFKDTLDRVQREFQDAFVEAYEGGELPTLDLQHGTKLYYKETHDWITLIDWAVKTIPVFSSELQLPASRDVLDRKYDVKSTPTDIQDSRDKMEYSQATNSKRDEVIHNMNFSRCIRVKDISEASKDMEVARSWARATCAIPDTKYDAQETNAKLNKLDQSILTTAMKALHVEKVIAHSFKGRTKAARNYHLSAQYSDIFNRRALNHGDFADAIAFKSRLDKAFASPTSYLLLDYVLNDGAYLALTELVGAGRIQVQPVLPPINSRIGDPFPRLTVWGFNEGQYKLRSMDKRTFLWDIKIVPTHEYVMDIPIESKLIELPPPMTAKPTSLMKQNTPHGGDDTDVAGHETHDKIPLWYDLHGNLLPNYWNALVRSVSQHMAMKAGSSIHTLTTPFKGLLWEWEIKLLVDWFSVIGVAALKDGGVRAKEWWWAVGVVSEDHGAGEHETGRGIVHIDSTVGVVEKIKAAARPAPSTPKRKRIRRSRKGTTATRVGEGSDA